jgi:GNAT superfamily N-acetyltransferase
MTSDMILQLLEERELIFNEEIHNLVTGQKHVMPIFAPGLDSDTNLPVWVLTKTDEPGADWNIVKYFGNKSNINSKDLLLLPKCNLKVFIPEHADLIQDKGSESNILVYSNASIDCGIDRQDIIPKNISLQKIELDLKSKWDIVVRHKCESGKFFNGKYNLKKPSFYFLIADEIVAYIKTIHETKNTVEPYLEVRPDYRDKGLGRCLLNYFIAYCIDLNKTVVYQVEEINCPSIKVALDCGLNKAFTWKTIAF